MLNHSSSHAREREDAANLDVLIASIRISLAEQGSINPEFHGELGRALGPAAATVHAQFDQIATSECAPQWLAQFDAAAAGTAHELHQWLGKKLAHTTAPLEPMFLAILAELEAQRSATNVGLEANLRHLRDLYDFDAVESQLLALAAASELSTIGLSGLDIGAPAHRVYRALAAAIQSTSSAARDALHCEGRLYKAGVLLLSQEVGRSLDEMLRLSTFGKQFFKSLPATAKEFFDIMLEPVMLSAAHPFQWPGMEAEERTVRAILEAALVQRTSGINIVLVGAAGAGKSAFARHLARTLPCTAFQVSCKDSDENGASPLQRLASLQAASRLLDVSAPALIVFDEADGIFPNAALDHRRMTAPGAIGRIAWFDSALKSNIHPTLWIVSEADNIDLSLFTFCMRFDAQHFQVRRQIAQQLLAPVGVSDAAITAVAQRREFSKELVARCATVVGLAGGKADSHDQVAMTHLNSEAKFMQLPDCVALPQPATHFDAGYLHLEGGFTAVQVIDAIARNGSGTVLMNGPPGTGKTQLARQIVDALGRQLLYLTASDINAKWFGESERNVARIFRECDPKSQVIFLDEAETVLGAREEAAHRGSESVTAEFLRQLESFTGVFLCATNHANRLDSALIRRFTFRLEFKPMTLAQRARMLGSLLSEATLSQPCLKALEGLDGLTPGDFANVRKRFSLLGCEPHADDWLTELALEWRAKPGCAANRRIGFI